jgi:hypothetical protein
MAERFKVKRIGGRESENGRRTEGRIWLGWLGLGASAGTCPGENATFTGLFILRGGVVGGVRIGIAHSFIHLGHIPRSSARVYDRHVLWEGTSGRGAVGVRIRTENGRARRRWK